ncbi:peptidase M14 [bacterium]|nr:peptidase M14 [bacterium]
MRSPSCIEWLFGPLAFILCIGLLILCVSPAHAASGQVANPAARLETLPANAAEQQPYPQMGAPANPRVDARFNAYHDYQQATQLMQELVRAFPEYASLQSLGQSYGGREMWVLTISDPATGPAESKPAMWIDGCIHANEIQATEVVLYTAWFLLETRASNSFIQQLLRERTFYLMPIMSPDSRDSHFYDANTTHSPRTGMRPVDEDRDGLVDEDGPEDMDGDGHIAQIRVADPNGRWLADKDYPQRMTRAKPEERGTHTLLGEEGYDNDGDGLVNEDGPGGYDPNRNWGYNWQPEYIQGGAHQYPFSILENRMVADFMAAHPNIAGAQSYHNSGGMILHGPGAQNTPYPGQDDQLYRAIAEKGAQMLPGYKPMVIWEDLYTVYGGEVDFIYACLGAFTYTNELFTTHDFFHSDTSQEDWQGSRSEPRKFDDLLLFDQGFVDWHPAEHPTYGAIEIGGQKKGWGRQPPSFMLEEECHRNMAFSLYHADMLPLVEVQSVSSRELPGGLLEVTAVVGNRRMIPTRLAIDVSKGISRPDWISIDIAPNRERNAAVLAGYIGSDQFFSTASEQADKPWRLNISSIPGNGAVYCRWIVRSGKGPITVTVDSVKGGRASASL